MPSRPNTTSESSRPQTRSRNINIHPGTAAEEALRVKAPRRDPVTIQKEKDAAKERKELKAQKKNVKQAKNDATKQIADEFRAQQVSEQANSEAEMPRKKSKVSSNVTQKTTSSRSSGRTNTGTTGEKRKSELQATTPTQDDEQGPPLPKKKKTMGSVGPSQSSAATTPMERNKHNASSNAKKMDNVSKKRPGDETFIDANPVTPAHPAKKAKVNYAAAMVDNAEALPRIPIRRTETMIYEVGSEIVTHKPTSSADSYSDTEVESGSEATPRQQDGIQGKPNTSEGPYETPVILRTKRGVVQVENDTDENSASEIEREILKGIVKRKKEMTHENLKQRANLSLENASTKSRTTSANDVAAVTRSENANSNLKKSNKSRVIKISDPEESDDDSLEREAALASPAKGAESRKATKNKVANVKTEPSPIPAGQVKIVKTIVIPYFIAIYMGEGTDPWRPLTTNDFETLGDLYLRACGEPIGRKITENDEIVKQTRTRLYDLRNKIAAQGQDATKAKFVKQLGKDALGDREKRMQFGLEWCKDGEYKFVYSGYDNGKRRLTGKYMSTVIMETFAEFFKYGEPTTKLPDLEVQMPVNALALAVSAVERALVLYRDDHLEYKDDSLYIKKEKVLSKKGAKGNQGGGDDSAADNNGTVYKEVRPVKLDFSATNFKASVTGWRLAIDKKFDILFPAVCVSARGIIGVVAATSAAMVPQDLQILSQANLPSEDEEDTQANPEQVGDDGVDEDHHRESLNNGDDNGIQVGGGDSGDDNDEDSGSVTETMGAAEDVNCDISEEDDYVGGTGSTTLTDINSESSDSNSESDAGVSKTVKVVPGRSLTRRKGV